jgi:hypothetical protein
MDEQDSISYLEVLKKGVETDRVHSSHQLHIYTEEKVANWKSVMDWTFESRNLTR